MLLHETHEPLQSELLCKRISIADVEAARAMIRVESCMFNELNEVNHITLSSTCRRGYEMVRYESFADMTLGLIAYNYIFPGLSDAYTDLLDLDAYFPPV